MTHPRYSLLLLLLTSSAGAAVTTLSPGVTYEMVDTDTPVKMRLHYLRIDLTQPTLKVRVVPSAPDPDGDGPYQTTLLPVPDVAKRENFLAAINGDFFDAAQPANVKSNPFASLKQQSYKTGTPAKVIGCATTDSHPWSTPTSAHSYLAIDPAGHASIGWGAPPANSVQVVGGGHLIIDQGKTYPERGTTRNAFTAAGVSQDGTRLTLLVVDGPRLGISNGASTADVQSLLVKENCYAALTLDGGGSSTIVIKEADQYAVKNHPTDGSPRPVANVLGITLTQAP